MSGSMSPLDLARTTLEEFDGHVASDLSRVDMAFWLGQLSHALRVLTAEEAEAFRVLDGAQ
jgi:hypothetical protein